MPDCLSHIKAAISNQAVIYTDSDELTPYYRGTEGIEQKVNKSRNIIAVVKPASIEDIQMILQLANAVADDKCLRFTLHPISSGLNWGYGTSQPPRLDIPTVILDLSTLQMIEFDDELGLITIEPGVTQGQLSQYLISLGDEYMVPVTGAGPDCSLVGNAIERGYGITPYTDHFGAVTSIQGYWANGDSYCSAVSELDKSDKSMVDKTYKWGLGPYLDGLFTQSNFGIVTKMTLRLAKTPQKFISFIIQIPADESLELTTPLIRKVLRDYEGIVGSINLMDKRRVLSMFAENPSGGKHMVMTDQEIGQLTQQLKTPSWTIMGSIYGTKGVAIATKKEIKTIFSQLACKQLFSDDKLITCANFLLNHLPDVITRSIPLLSLINKQITSFNRGKEIMLGKPNKMALKLAYWRHSNADSFNADSLSPGRDGCGLLWYAPLVTMKPDDVRAYVTFVRNTCPKYNIEPLITFTNLKHDCVDSTIPIVFDLSNPQAVADAHNCLNELVNKGLALGYVPYRLNIDQQQGLLDPTTPFWQTINAIKSVLDPNDILSLGRYNPK